MIEYLLYTLFFGIGLFVLYLPFRWFCCSFFLSYLYDHPNFAKMLGIEFRDDITWHTNREDTKIYIPGIYGYLFSKFTGLNIVSDPQTIKEILYEQGAHAKKITMEPYLIGLAGKRMSLVEFEDYLSNCILTETNKCFEIIDAETEKEFRSHLGIMRQIISGLTSDSNKSVRVMITFYSVVRKITNIIHKLSPGRRLILLVPHLSLIDGFSKMILKTNGDLTGITASSFFDFTSRFFVFLHKGKLTFVTRTPDYTNNANNRAFGLVNADFIEKQRVFCPGNIFVTKFIMSVISLLKTFKIDVEGDTTITNERFRNIANKHSIMLTFNKIENAVYDNNTNVFGDITSD